MGGLKDGLGGGTGISGVIGEITVDTIVATNKKLYFRDTGISIHSDADGSLVLTSDGTGNAVNIKLAGDKTGAASFTVRDSDNFPVSKLDSAGNVQLKGRQKRTTTN